MASAQQKVVVVIVGKDELSSVSAKVKQALQDLGNASEEVGRKTEGLSTKSIALGSMLGNLAGSVVQGLIRDFNTMKDQAFEVASAYEQQSITLTRLLGSQELATQSLERWNDESVKTPFTPEKYRDAAISLKAYNIALKDVSSYLKTAGDAASAFADKISLEQMVDTLGRLKSGQFGESFEQLRRIGISMQDLKGEGLEFDQGGQYVGSVDDALKAVQKIIEERFGGMMEEQAKSAKGLISTIQGNWEQLLKTMMDSGPYDYIKRKLSEINDALDYMNTASKRPTANIYQEQLNQVKDSMNYLLDIQKKFIAEGGSMTEWAKLGQQDVKALQTQLYEYYDSIKSYWQKAGYSEEKAIQEATIQTAKEFAGETQKVYDSINKAKKSSEEYAKAAEEVATRHRENIVLGSKYKSEWEKLNKVIEKSPATIKPIIESTKKAKEETDKYQELLKSLADKTLPSLEKKYEAVGMVLNDIASGKVQYAPETIKNLNTEFTELGVTLGKFGKGFKESDMEGFIDDLDEVQKSAEELVEPLLTLMSLGTGLFAFGGGGGTAEALSDIEEITMGLQQWSDGMAEFLDMLGLAGGELSEVSAGISQIGQGIQQLVEAGDDFSATMNGINSIMQGISGLFGEESDMSKLISGASNVGTGIAKAVSGDLSGIIQAIAGLPDLLDGLFESTQEGYVKQLEKQGFNDQYSEELLDKMSEVSDRMGDKSYGMKAYIEDFFKETNIDTAEEFSRMSDLLNESIGEYMAQGHTAEEAYEKFGDELEQLTDAEKEYGFETTASLDQMLALQREQTKEGRVGGISDAISGIDKMIEGMSKAGYSEASFSSVFGLLQSSFQKLQAEGLSMQEIFEKISPAVEKAKEAAEKAGYSTESMDALLKYYDMMKDASPILDVISGLEMAIEGLSSTGTLTQQNLTDMATTAQETYKKLQAQGFNETQIAQFMGPSISQMTEAAEKFGYDLPADIVKLGEQVEKMGFGEEKSPAEEIANWGEQYLAQTKEWGDQMLKTLENLGGYQEGGIVPNLGNQKQLGWIHPGETIVPEGTNFSIGTQIDKIDSFSSPIVSSLNSIENMLANNNSLSGSIGASGNTILDAINNSIGGLGTSIKSQNAIDEQNFKSLLNINSYQEGGIVPGSGNQKQLGFLHPGETILPSGAIPFMPSAQPAQVELKLTIQEKSGGEQYLKNLIGTTVETKTKNGEIKIFQSAIENE